ncbi:Type II secretion system (T2SS)-associated protein Gcp11 [Andalucia godoyi]|uniref:Type II secretion system (T2SS)-associated protein Gcp11 n=1 Tax=Andalucia godoyi TaxID=505711 RepID=A0A8K0AJW8_ANDGO|nr:Type II secretion system (T2SS)-associated protein Gcp11 [Andalucia godoyi]|eukprot:ANDGO_06995.mRNA.1 Type II secretion system (T2SS)-associated protein Gcp11
MLIQGIAWIVGALAASQLHSLHNAQLQRPLPPLELGLSTTKTNMNTNTNTAGSGGLNAVGEKNYKSPSSSPASSAYFGERPHYFYPPSDVEPYRKRPSSSPSRRRHVVIPYPDDPPHTFPSIKVRQLFTRHPKVIRSVDVRDGLAKARVAGTPFVSMTAGSRAIPLKAMEDRFRSIMENAKADGLDVVIGHRAATPSSDHSSTTMQTYDFHGGAALRSPKIF